MNILIVDDEAPARERLRYLVEQIGAPYTVSAEAENGQQAIEMSQQFEIDIILLDIRMPVMDGLKTASQVTLSERPPAVIFVTAYDAHAIEAFENNAIDYLLKPVRQERLQLALEKAHGLNRAQLQVIDNEDTLSNENVRTHLCVRYRGQMIRISVKDVVYFKSDNKYVTAYLKDTELLLDESLKALESEFATRFLRIHRNALVNKDCISGITKVADGGSVLLLSTLEHQLDISRRHLSEVKSWLAEGKQV